MGRRGGGRKVRPYVSGEQILRLQKQANRQKAVADRAYRERGKKQKAAKYAAWKRDYASRQERKKRQAAQEAAARKAEAAAKKKAAELAEAKAKAEAEAAAENARKEAERKAKEEARQALFKELDELRDNPMVPNDDFERTFQSWACHLPTIDPSDMKLQIGKSYFSATWVKEMKDMLLRIGCPEEAAEKLMSSCSQHSGLPFAWDGDIDPYTLSRDYKPGYLKYDRDMWFAKEMPEEPRDTQIRALDELNLRFVDPKFFGMADPLREKRGLALVLALSIENSRPKDDGFSLGCLMVVKLNDKELQGDVPPELPEWVNPDASKKLYNLMTQRSLVRAVEELTNGDQVINMPFKGAWGEGVMVKATVDLPQCGNVKKGDWGLVRRKVQEDKGTKWENARVEVDFGTCVDGQRFFHLLPEGSKIDETEGVIRKDQDQTMSIRRPLGEKIKARNDKIIQGHIARAEKFRADGKVLVTTLREIFQPNTMKQKVKAGSLGLVCVTKSALKPVGVWLTVDFGDVMKKGHRFVSVLPQGTVLYDANEFKVMYKAHVRRATDSEIKAGRATLEESIEVASRSYSEYEQEMKRKKEAKKKAAEAERQRKKEAREARKARIAAKKAAQKQCCVVM